MKNHSKVQFGCGLCTPEGWFNLDSTPTLWVARLPLARSLAGVALKLGVATSGSNN